MNLCVQTNPTRLPENWQIASVVLGLHNLAATIVAVRAHVVTQMDFTRGRLDSDRGRGEESCERCMPRLDGDFLFC